MQRLIAILLAVFFLGLAGLMASVTLFVRDPIPIVTARSPLVVQTGEAAAEGLRATLAMDPTFRFEVRAEGAKHEAGPGIALRRGDGGGEIAPTVEAPAPGIFIARGQFTAPGRWTLDLTDDGQSWEFPFILQE